jgi:hypothetical protein
VVDDELDNLSHFSEIGWFVNLILKSFIWTLLQIIDLTKDL